LAYGVDDFDSLNDELPFLPDVDMVLLPVLMVQAVGQFDCIFDTEN